ncbi:IMP cyclohydrolase [Nocardia tengchongensis]|uniref:IMP cyclohydrolase n=1 Tax=Nocardia tengchongensis TaxID=2055889 RepID=UPI0036AC0351
MTSEYALGFSSFVARYRYLGRGIALGRDAQGVGFAAYWLTGRSPESRGRQLIVDSDALEISDIARSQSDPLRHYTAIIRGADRIVVGNGTQVVEVGHDLDAGVGPFEALAKLEYEPDPPIRTPRITATARVAGGEVHQVILSGAVAHPQVTRFPGRKKAGRDHPEPVPAGQRVTVTEHAGGEGSVTTGARKSVPGRRALCRPGADVFEASSARVGDRGPQSRSVSSPPCRSVCVANWFPCAWPPHGWACSNAVGCLASWSCDARRAG